MPGKMARSTLDQAFGLPEVLVAVSTSRLSCKRAGKTRTLMPVWDSSGESRMKSKYVQLTCMLVLAAGALNTHRCLCAIYMRSINPPKIEDLSRPTTLMQGIASLKLFIQFQTWAMLEA
jgi:hypothetical protein